MNEKTEPSEFMIKVNAGDLEKYLNEKAKEEVLLDYSFNALVLIPGSEAPYRRVNLFINKKASEKYELKEASIEVEIRVSPINLLNPFLNEEALKEIEEGRGIEFIGFIPGPPKVVVMTPARIKFLPLELLERIN
jgi:hypothetical protein